MFFGGEQVWDRMAMDAAEALRIFEDSVCGGCGQSALLSHEAQSAGEYVVMSSTCISCQVLESSAPKTHPPGKKRYVIATHDMTDEQVEALESGSAAAGPDETESDDTDE